MIVTEVDHGIRLGLRITELVWADGGRSFEVHRESDGADLTEDGCYDAMPTDAELAALGCDHEEQEVRDGQFYCRTCDVWLGR